MGTARSMSAMVPDIPRLVITVEHPDGTISHIPVVRQDKNLVARLPAGTTIVDIAPQRTASMDVTGPQPGDLDFIEFPAMYGGMSAAEAEIMAGFEGRAPALSDEHKAAQKAKNDTAAESVSNLRGAPSVLRNSDDEISHSQLLVLIKHEAEKLVNLLKQHQEATRALPLCRHDVINGLDEIRRLTMALRDGPLPCAC